MELEEVLRARRSSRHFGEEPVPRATIEALITLAATAPSAGNRQPWRVEALAPQAARRLVDEVEPLAWEILYPTLREVIARDKNVLGEQPSGRELTDKTVEFVQRNIFLRGSFWLLVVHFPRHSVTRTARTLASTAEFVRHRVLSRATLAERAALVRFLATRTPRAIECDLFADLGSVAGFMYGLTLAATDHGLASCIQYTYGLVQPEVRRLLSLERDDEVLGAVAIGVPAPDVDPAQTARNAFRRPVPVRWRES